MDSWIIWSGVLKNAQKRLLPDIARFWGFSTGLLLGANFMRQTTLHNYFKFDMIRFTGYGVIAEKPRVGHLPIIFPCTLYEKLCVGSKNDCHLLEWPRIYHHANDRTTRAGCRCENMVFVFMLGGGIKQWCCLTSDVCMSLSVAYIVNIHGAHSYWKQGALGNAGVRRIWAGAGPHRAQGRG